MSPSSQPSRLALAALSALCLYLCAGAAATHAAPVTLNFDNVGSGTVVSYPELGVNISTAYRFPDGSPQGAAGGGLVLASAQAHTGPNALFGVGLNPQAMLHNDLVVTFSLPGAGGAAATNFVSFYIVGTTPDQAALWRVEFYGAQNSILANFSGLSNGPVIFSTMANEITGFRLFVSNNMVGHQEGIDSLSFNAPVASVPEPTTLALLGVGLSGLALRARRRRRSRA